ncbi:hypothetical protein [Serratia marcescens]|uniref:Lipoprotein n=1 Tax=Serratia marcescens TaxID=615 RepID=A0AAP8PFT4_SERMA|nr:hypothetical protein [Serratia marcescens]PNO65055.1 hypothetical protein MC70_017790 [Serratia marcescens]
MKRLLAVMLATALLSGCTSYYTLQSQCRGGNVEACNTLSERDYMVGTAQAGLNGYNAQRLTEAQIGAYQNAASYTPILNDRASLPGVIDTT